MPVCYIERPTLNSQASVVEQGGRRKRETLNADFITVAPSAFKLKLVLEVQQ